MKAILGLIRVKVSLKHIKVVHDERAKRGNMHLISYHHGQSGETTFHARSRRNSVRTPQPYQSSQLLFSRRQATRI